MVLEFQRQLERFARQRATSQVTQLLVMQSAIPMAMCCHAAASRNGGAEGGYSVLMDGDTNTFWKSSPYLAQKFTGESDALHPQWVIVDLKKKEAINSLRIAWGEPFARKYQIQFWTGEDPIGLPTHGIWQALPKGIIAQGKGGEETIRFSDKAIPIQFLRVIMTESSSTCDADGPSDVRNCVGYAIRELYVGTSTANGEFHDLVRHTPDQDQTATYDSSVDPWHEPTNLLNTHQAQPGYARNAETLTERCFAYSITPTNQVPSCADSKGLREWRRLRRADGAVPARKTQPAVKKDGAVRAMRLAGPDLQDALFCSRRSTRPLLQ
jgi:hypothetical protein